MTHSEKQRACIGDEISIPSIPHHCKGNPKPTLKGSPHTLPCFHRPLPSLHLPPPPHPPTALSSGTPIVGGADLTPFLPADIPLDAANIQPAMFARPEPFATRRDKQVATPAFPTSTIGSFPQTAEVRRLRTQLKRGTITQEQYDAAIAGHIGFAIGMQEALEVDVYVHGEFERTDMVGSGGVGAGRSGTVCTRVCMWVCTRAILQPVHTLDLGLCVATVTSICAQSPPINR